ncbi:MAG: tyrosine-type recombinase/integrase [Gammaproteobacteria bacterium]
MIGSAYQDNGYVFAQPDGSVWHPDRFTFGFRYLMQKAGIAYVRFHDLRYSHAAQLLIQSIHPKVVSERLGHLTVGITLNTYSQVGLARTARRSCGQGRRCAPARRNFEQLKINSQQADGQLMSKTVNL